ncbi:hypothetical protein EYF80_039178 [Liparis tanakae]|uniref:Uncharacterized protein n=1 Tax=Liparis tanakae TaxID=230148 RepID=A0A4Z2GD19_9TELE|nr:hypothetical protein EYF80_039178 [Liparis tanakae]
MSFLIRVTTARKTAFCCSSLPVHLGLDLHLIQDPLSLQTSTELLLLSVEFGLPLVQGDDLGILDNHLPGDLTDPLSVGPTPSLQLSVALLQGPERLLVSVHRQRAGVSTRVSYAHGDVDSYDHNETQAQLCEAAEEL